MVTVVRLQPKGSLLAKPANMTLGQKWPGMMTTYYWFNCSCKHVSSVPEVDLLNISVRLKEHKFIEMIVIKYVMLKAAAKWELLFNKLASD